MPNKKAQVAPEILLGIGIVTFLFLLIAIFALNKQIETGDTKEYLEKRGECLKFANLINSLFMHGKNTEVRTSTDYIVTLFNSSQIAVEDIDEYINYVPTIAILASEASPTTLEVYETINNELENAPDWYKICFSDIGSAGCDTEETSWMETTISNDIDELMTNLDSYDTVYLDSPTLQYATDYIETLENWTARGNALIVSKHLMCRERVSGSFPSTSYQCNPPGDNNDEWRSFDTFWHQRDEAFGWPNECNVEIMVADEAFDIYPGDLLSFSSRSYVLENDSENFRRIARYRNLTDASCDGFCLEDSNLNPAIAHWSYGQGKVFYIGDPLPTFIDPYQKFFPEVIATLLEVAQLTITHPETESEIICSVSTRTHYQKVTGEIVLRNENNVVYAEDD